MLFEEIVGTNVPTISFHRTNSSIWDTQKDSVTPSTGKEERWKKSVVRTSRYRGWEHINELNSRQNSTFESLS